ncbi:MAG: FGGY-family carbohydrate kinase [Eubacterium sp.]|nr:FGGY-family carbohydrate kinase [Eubacterium sp.]
MGIEGKIKRGETALGIEFGSTRIKAVLVTDDGKPAGSGSYTWENRYINGIWTYTLEDIQNGLQAAYSDLIKNLRMKYSIIPKTYGSIGISAMMHGYMAFDSEDRLLVPFRTWRNTITEKAADELTALLQYPIPQRWNIAHLYHSILNNEQHLDKLSYITTLAGYVHFMLTSQHVIGIGDASGMFPIDIATRDYNKEMISAFDAAAKEHGFDKPLEGLLPQVLCAGEHAGQLTEEGARLLDPSGHLEAGIPLCPPEGDAGTGMTATNSVRPRTGNVSAGTSVFAMVVLDKELEKLHKEIDLVTTPSGDLTAMVHCNNCTSELNAWVGIFRELVDRLGYEVDTGDLYKELFEISLIGDADCGGLTACNYLSGEHITGFDEGRPMFVRTPDSSFTLANFMRAQLFSSLATLKIGLDILLKEEKVGVDRITGHGGFFKTENVGQRILAAAANAPVSVMKTAVEGGAWGIALLAAYMTQKKDGESLADWLDGHVFCDAESSMVSPVKEDRDGFDSFMERYKKTLNVERTAVDSL